MNDTELIEWLATHPVAASGLSEQFYGHTLIPSHWHDTREQRIAHFRKLINGEVERYQKAGL